MFLVRPISPRLLLLITFAAATGMPPARAALVTDSVTGSRSGAGSLNLSLDQFNPALGTLTNVLISASFNGESALTPSDTCTPDANGVCDTDGKTDFGKLTGSLSLVAPGPTTLLSATDIETKTVTCIDVTNDGHGVQCTTYLNVSDSEADIFTDPTLLGWFEGTGTFNVIFNLETLGLSPFYTRLRGNARVTYTYDEPQNVPEPGSLALAALAGAGLWLTSRRRATDSKPRSQQLPQRRVLTLP